MVWNQIQYFQRPLAITWFCICLWLDDWLGLHIVHIVHCPRERDWLLEMSSIISSICSSPSSWAAKYWNGIDCIFLKKVLIAFFFTKPPQVFWSSRFSPWQSLYPSPFWSFCPGPESNQWIMYLRISIEWKSTQIVSCEKIMFIPLTKEILPWENLPLF